MAEQHEINDIVRRIKRETLEQLFVKLGIEGLDDGWKKSKCRDIKPLCDALAKLPEEEQDEIGETLEKIAPVGKDKKNIPVILCALDDMGVKFPEDLPEEKPAEIACWCFNNLTTPQWKLICLRTEINNHTPGEWKSYDLEFDEPPKPGLVAGRQAEIEKAVKQIMTRKEFRGRHCKSQCYTVGMKDNIMLKVTDHKTDDEIWDDEAQDFKELPGAMSFKIVFSFDNEMGRVSILHTRQTKMYKDLCKAFADAVFGKDGYRHMSEVKYAIQQFKEKSKLPSLPEHGIREVTIIGLDLLLDGSRKRRRSYFEAERDLQTTIAEEVSKGLLQSENTLVQRVLIRIMYDTKKKSNVTRTLRISETSIANITSAPKDVQKAWKEYMKIHDITIPKNENNAVANEQAR